MTDYQQKKKLFHGNQPTHNISQESDVAYVVTVAKELRLESSVDKIINIFNHNNEYRLVNINILWLELY